jgi:glycosidase
MTGNAFIYYGEELGMKGSGKDENKRAPMYWVTKGEDPSASEEEGALSALMTAGPPDMDKVDMKFDGFDRQKDDPYSVYNYFRNAVLLRNAFPVIAGGKTSVVDEMTGDSVCAFLRTGDGKENSPESVLIVINTSDQAQKVSLSGEGEAFESLSGLLTVSEEEALLDGKELTLPPFGIAILTGGGD